MTTIDTATTLELSTDDFVVDDAQLATAAFLARYSGRTWMHTVTSCAASSSGRPTMTFRFWRRRVRTSSCTGAGWRSGAWRRRRSTVAYRRCAASTGSAHIDGRIASNPAQYVRRPQVHPSNARGLDRSASAPSCSPPSTTTAITLRWRVLLGLKGLRVSEACATNVEDLGLERGHRTLGVLGKGNKPATIPLVPRTARTIDLAVGERCEGLILRRRDGQRLDRRTAHRWIRSIGKRAGLARCIRTCCGRRSSWRRSTPASSCATCRSPLATPILAPPRSTTRVVRTSTVTPPTSWSPLSPAVDAASRRTMVGVSDAADQPDQAPHGTELLPSDLTEDQLAAAPVLTSIDTLLIEELSVDEDEAFANALGS